MKRTLNLETLEDRRVMTGAMQLSGVATLPGEAECTNVPEAPEGTELAFVMKMEGDLSGCFYSFASSAESSPSGTYRERGIDIYVGSGEEGDVGTFATTYLFTAKFDEEGNELWGRCQHPITAGTGTGDFEGMTGRLDFRDDVVNWTFPYKGHLRKVNPKAADVVLGASPAGDDNSQDALFDELSDAEG